MLTIKNLGYSTDGKDIIKGINYTFEDGKTYAILGNNGTGKSTLVKAIMGMHGYINKHKGKIYMDNDEITDAPLVERAKKGLSITLQEPVRFKGISVKNYLSLGGKHDFSKEKMEEALEMVGLRKEYLNRKVDKTLSGGERKRIELASIILLKPKVVIFDEPDSGIDMMSNTMLKDVFEELRANNTTVISITHREEISRIADRALLLCGGEIKEEGTPEKINKLYKETCDVCDHINEPEEDERV